MREYRIYSLMKWILRVHRRDPNRKTPLTMIDAGSNHGLFSLVAAASGARVVAFEPQPNLRSSIGLNARLNNVANRIRVLPFAILNKYRKLSMSQYETGDGGIGQLDFASKDTITNTQTVRLDDIPSLDSLFYDDNNHKTLINNPNEISANYANSLEACNAGTQTMIDESLTLRQPIHFLKIDVEGFELRALESASKLFELGLIENLIMEFGPPNRWERTVDTSDITNGQKRTVTTIHARYLMHRALNEWKMDIYLLPAFGWGKTVQWMYNRNIDYRENSTLPLGNFSEPTPNQRKVVHYLKYWDFDGMPMENDEFESEMRGKKQLVTEVIPLRESEVDDYMSDLESIGEIYIWFAKRDSNQNVLKKLEL
ncbi:hypothetical protein BDC45DRAFT_86933 [Circinella umbellata]|nr:hypothetical protein BDC45DRAFT_86933 [Circinella umbellata]